MIVDNNRFVNGDEWATPQKKKKSCSDGTTEIT